MNYCNYTIFEILKYKIEFLDCLEYSMESFELHKEKLQNNLLYLKTNIESGTYKEILSSLFKEYEKVNKPIIDFFNNYTIKNLTKMISSKKASLKIEFIKCMIDCYETLNSIINSFTSEKYLINKIDKNLTDLINTNNEHFKHFLYFITYNMYIKSLYKDKTKIKFKEKDIKDIISLINYCNEKKEYDKSIKILKENNELNINNELERLSNKCIELEKKQTKEVKELLNIINKEIENNKKE